MASKGDFDEKMRALKQGGIAKSTAESMKGKLGLKKAGSGASEPAPLAEHTVASGDSLSAIALKYYKSGARDKWMAIYEANKDTIGDNPSLVRVGQVLKIPKLDD